MPAEEQPAPKSQRIEASVKWAAGTAFYLEALRDACYEARSVCEGVERRAGAVLLTIVVTALGAGVLIVAVGLFGGLTPVARITPVVCGALASFLLTLGAWFAIRALDERDARWMRLDRLVAEKNAALASQQAQQRFIETLRLQVDFNAKLMDLKSDALQRASTCFRIGVLVLLAGYLVAAAEFAIPGGFADRAERAITGQNPATADPQWVDGLTADDLPRE